MSQKNKILRISILIGIVIAALLAILIISKLPSSSTLSGAKANNENPVSAPVTQNTDNKSNDDQTPDSNSSSASYSNILYNYQVDYPSTWNSCSGNACVGSAAMEDDRVATIIKTNDDINLPYHKVTIDTTNNLLEGQTWAQKKSSIITMAEGNAQPNQKVSTVTYNGIEMVEIDYTGTFAEDYTQNNYSVRRFYFANPKVATNYFIVTAGDDNNKSTAQDIESIISSFKFN